MTGKTELLATIEKIREEHFADLPKELVEAIIEAESDFTEEPAEAYKRVAATVEKYLTDNKGAR